MDKCLYQQLEGKGLHRASSVEVRGGRRKTARRQQAMFGELDLNAASGIDRNRLLSPCLLSDPGAHPQWVWGLQGAAPRGSGATGRPELISSLSAGTQRGEMGQQDDQCPLV